MSVGYGLKCSISSMSAFWARRAVMSLSLRVIALYLCIASASAERYRIGIVTMHSPEIMSYANMTAAQNRRYAERHGYGFHIFDHVIDQTRVPHWSKLHAVQLFLAEYDFVFWIDADAIFYDQSRRIEEVLAVDSRPDGEIWAQDIWPDYPSLSREEKIDTGTVLFRNSRWTRQFLLEMYYFPACEKYLNWTEQYCFTVAHQENLMDVRDKLVILPTPRINHHRLPPPEDPHSLFIFHYAGRSSKARKRHFRLIDEGAAEKFRESPDYDSFWRFRKLFENQRFGDLASLQVCLFGLGKRHQAFLDALMFHLPYLAAFTVIKQGSAGLWTQMKTAELLGDKFGSRMALIDIMEYLRGKTREGETFVQGFFCDLLVLGVESWRHVPGIPVLSKLVGDGLEPFVGESRRGFGFSALSDCFFVWDYTGCTGGPGGIDAVASGAPLTPNPGEVLDKDDEDGSALEQACAMLEESRGLVQWAVQEGRSSEAAKGSSSRSKSGGYAGKADAHDGSMEVGCEGAACAQGSGSSKKVPWKQRSPELWGMQSSGSMALGRVPRQPFKDR
eukprot:TRINITY_DN20509_c0_g1_i2.p1 TRINITY_DN20509_c0_g1~~TRINITY_DN20509_c0_g1_i2.p1  ORF type:complete len:576 (-),score=50.35 TRINITY_DN20509_c0_g1_i2:27-1703(-)